jgi:putative FmdB family regulatory protein
MRAAGFMIAALHPEERSTRLMPTYEYACKSCGETLEVFQSFADKPLKKHKGCGGELKKVFHARGIVFKGGGFYATDSRTSSSTKPSDRPAEKKSETKSSETKKSTKTGASSSTGGSTSSSDD